MSGESTRQSVKAAWRRVKGGGVDKVDARQRRLGLTRRAAARYAEATMLQALLIWTALGFVAGLLAKWIMPGSQGWNPITTILLGIVGSIAGGWIGAQIGIGDATGTFSVKGILVAAGGALLLMFLWGLIFGKKK